MQTRDVRAELKDHSMRRIWRLGTARERSAVNKAAKRVRKILNSHNFDPIEVANFRLSATLHQVPELFELYTALYYFRAAKRLALFRIEHRRHHTRPGNVSMAHP